MNLNMKLNLSKIDLKQQKVLIFIIIVVLITLFFGKKIWDSQRKKSANIRGKIKDYQEKIELASGINKLSKEFEKFKDVGWHAEESVSIMGKISELASEHGVEIFTFDPGGLRDNKDYFTLSMNLNIKADYFSLYRFLSAIDGLETLTKITNLQIRPQRGSDLQEDGPMVEANLKITAFIFKK